MIYAIHAKGTSFVKFGVAKNMGKRLVQHQVSCPHELVILAVADWPNWVEGYIHNRLGHLLVRGEWFLYEGMAVAVVDAMRSGGNHAALDGIPSESSEFVRRRLDRVVSHAVKLASERA